MTKRENIRRHREIIDLLLKEKVITEDQLREARQEGKRTGLTIDCSLIRLGYITREDILRIQADALEIPYLDLTNYKVDQDLIKLVPKDIAKRCMAVPLFKIGENLTVGMVDPLDIESLDQVRRVSQAAMVEPVLVSEAGLQKILDAYYGAGESYQEIIDSINADKINSTEVKGLVEVAEEPPIIKLVNTLIAQAVKERVSDIHVEPEEGCVRVRSRVDGTLYEVTLIPKKLQNAVISRIKILAKMDIAESRRAQDGRIKMTIEKKDLDIRVSSFPTIYGENIVMRLLDKSAALKGLTEIGFMEEDKEKFVELIKRPHGIIFVTGPTGSGKTTTLYSALSVISCIEKNIITIEDPVEYEMPLIRQTEVNPKAGITFANGLRSILRQDPDIIMVGEIRDKETADVAIRAALTGHLVFSTLHTNDAPTAITRLLDMEVESFLLSSATLGILAQRLVRTICEKCKEQYTPHNNVFQMLDIPASTKLFRGKGCEHCKHTGFMGRIGIFEILPVNEEIRSMIEQNKPSDEIRKKAQQLGMQSLRQDGLAKVKQGLTTPEEIIRVTKLER